MVSPSPPYTVLANAQPSLEAGPPIEGNDSVFAKPEEPSSGGAGEVGV